MKSFRRWQLLHVGPSSWGVEPECHTIPLGFAPGQDAVAFSTPSFLVVRSVGASGYLPDVYGIDPLSGSVLWRFSEVEGDALLMHLHVEEEERIVATTPKGVYWLERTGPRMIFKRELEPTSIARFTPDGRTGFVLDSNNRLLCFSSERKLNWSQKPRSRRRFQNPFPREDGSVCLSATQDLLCLDPGGDRLWSWNGVSSDTPHANQESRYSIAMYVKPDLLLARSVEHSSINLLVFKADTGEFCGNLGDIWPYGADGVAQHPVVMLDASEKIAFLQADGSISVPEKTKAVMGKFCAIPEGHVALFYDNVVKGVACVGLEGNILWRESYPDGKSGPATVNFMKDTAFFVTTAGNLHVWDWYQET